MIRPPPRPPPFPYTTLFRSTTVLTPIVVLASWGDIHRRVKEFFAFLLVLETGMLGTLVALDRSEEHTSELQSLTNLVCRLLLEKKNISSFAADTVHIALL